MLAQVPGTQIPGDQTASPAREASRRQNALSRRVKGPPFPEWESPKGQQVRQVVFWIRQPCILIQVGILILG